MANHCGCIHDRYFGDPCLQLLAYVARDDIRDMRRCVACYDGMEHTVIGLVQQTPPESVQSGHHPANAFALREPCIMRGLHFFKKLLVYIYA